MKLLKMSNLIFFYDVFYVICILKSFNSHISVLPAASLNLGRSQNGVLGNGLKALLGQVSRYWLHFVTVIIIVFSFIN